MSGFSFTSGHFFCSSAKLADSLLMGMTPPEELLSEVQRYELTLSQMMGPAPLMKFMSTSLQ